MAVSREMRKRIDNLLAVYLNWLEQHQAGWHSENDLQRLAQWKGDLPPPSGMDTSNDFMIGAVSMTRERHAKLVVVQHLIGKPQPCGDCGREGNKHEELFASELNAVMSEADIPEHERASWIRSNWPVSSGRKVADETDQPEYKTCRDWLMANSLPSESELKALSEALGVKPASLLGQAAKQNCGSCSGLGIRLVKGIIKPDYAMPLLAERYWPKDPARVVCERLALSPKQYEGRLAKGRGEMGRELGYYDQVRALVIRAEGMRNTSL